MRKLLIILIIGITLATPVFATDMVDTDLVPTIKTPVKELPHKKPVSKKALVKKFLFAMSGVVISSLILYIGLTAYNKIRYNVIKTATSDYSNTLNTPDNLKDAVNIYLEKTRN